MDLILLYKALMRKKMYLILIPILSALVSIYFTKDFKRMFKSSATMSTGFTVSEQVSVTEERFNIFQADIKFNNLIETMTSEQVFGLLSCQLLLHDLEGKEDQYKEEINNAETKRIYSAISKEEIIELLKNKIDSLQVINAYNDRERKVIDLMKVYKYDYRSLRERIHVFRVDGTDYMEIVSHSERPKLSADAVNILCDQFFRYYTYQEANKSSESVQSFKKLVEQKELELQAAEESLRVFKTENGIINLDASAESKIGQITVMEDKKEEENQNIRAIRLELDQVNRELTKYAKGNNSNNSELLEIRRKIQDLSERRLNSGSNDDMFQDSINYYRTQLSKTIDFSSNSDLVQKKEDLETRLDIAKEHLTSISRRLYSLNSEIGTDANVQARLANLDREVNRASEEYLSAQEKYNTALDLASVKLGSLRQISLGQPAMEPEPSKRIIITALSGAASFVFCLIVIIFLEYIDVSLKSPYNFQRIFESTHLLGVINKIKLSKKEGIAALFDSTVAKPKKQNKTFRELLRKLRFEIQDSGKKIFLITSNKPGEGKSLFIEALCLGLSAARKRVLIIDANFSNNTLTQLYSANPVLENLVVEGDVTLADQVVETAIEGVDIIGCQGGDYSPSEVMDLEKFGNEVVEFKNNYDYVIIEAAALNFYTDTKELVQYIEGVIAVYSAESVIKELDKESMSVLIEMEDKFLGVVLNKVKPENINQ